MHNNSYFRLQPLPGVSEAPRMLREAGLISRLEKLGTNLTRCIFIWSIGGATKLKCVSLVDSLVPRT